MIMAGSEGEQLQCFKPWNSYAVYLLEYVKELAGSLQVQ